MTEMLDPNDYTLRQNLNFTDEAVEVDGNYFADCTFTNCRLIYRGDKHWGHIGCTFPGTQIELHDAALRVIQTLTKTLEPATMLALLNDVAKDQPTTIH